MNKIAIFSRGSQGSKWKQPKVFHALEAEALLLVEAPHHPPPVQQAALFDPYFIDNNIILVQHMSINVKHKL